MNQASLNPLRNMGFHQLRSAQNATDEARNGGTTNSKLLSGLVSGMDFGAGEFNSNIDNMIAGLDSRDAEIELILNNLSASNELPVQDKGFVETVGDLLFDDIKPLADVKNHAKETYLNQGAKALEEGRTVDYYANLAGFVASEFAATTPFEIGMSLFGGVFGMVGKAKNVDAVIDVIPNKALDEINLDASPPGVSFTGEVHRYEDPSRVSTTWDVHKGNIVSDHRYSGPGYGATYGSTSDATALAEVAHHNVSTGRILVSKEVKVSNILDLTNPDTLSQLNIPRSQIVGDSYSVTQKIGNWAREVGYEGILAPSARYDGGSNLVIFPRKP